jgi:phosphoglycolate phosphatase
VDKHVTAVEAFLGRDLPIQERTTGKTDRQILCEFLEAQGNVPSPATRGQVLGLLDEISIKEINQYPVLCNPGVATALKRASSTGWVNGLLTGNTPLRARAKLKLAGIWGAVDSKFSYFGSESLSRGGLVSSSVRAIRSARSSVAIVIGDTPLDIRSAKEHKLQVVAVATVPYSAAELLGLGPDLLINDCESGWASLVDFLNYVHA